MLTGGFIFKDDVQLRWLAHGTSVLKKFAGAHFDKQHPASPRRCHSEVLSHNSSKSAAMAFWEAEMSDTVSVSDSQTAVDTGQDSRESHRIVQREYAIKEVIF